MALLDDVADGLAKRTVELMDDINDETLERRISQEIGSSSPTLEEAFLTAMRIRKAEIRGQAILDKYEAGQEIPAAAISSAPQD